MSIYDLKNAERVRLKVGVEASGFQLYFSSQKVLLERLERVCGIGHSGSHILS